MEFLIAKDLPEKCYLLANKTCFFHRFCDSGFKTKWTGFWVFDKKFIEYFAFKINDEWLSPLNCKSFYRNEISAKHIYSTKFFDVEEFLFLPSNLKSLICVLKLKNKIGKTLTAKISAEVAANIRKWNENWHNRTYELREIGKKILIKSKLGCLIFGSFPEGKMEFMPKYKDHKPGEELQRCFIPGFYIVKLNVAGESNVSFIFACGKDEREALSEYESIIGNLPRIYSEREEEILKLKSYIFDSNIEWLNQLFEISLLNLYEFWRSNKIKGFIAGYPWFLQIWGRDSGWILPAICDLGDFEKVKDCLKTLFDFRKEGKIPNFICFDGTCGYNSIDSTLLWLISLEHYLKLTNDISFLRELSSGIKEIEDFILSRVRNGKILCKAGESWMDTLSREGFNIDVQSMFARALKSLIYVKKMLGIDTKELEDLAIEAKNRVMDFYFKDFFIDNLANKKRTSNVLFAIFFETIPKPLEILKILESEEFSTKFGVVTLSRKEEDFDPKAYHKGSSWGILNGVMACCEFKYGNVKKGLEYLKILYNLIRKRCIGCIPEAWNSLNGNLLLDKKGKVEEAAISQAWNYALIIRCIDEYMLGFNIDLPNKVFIAKPKIPPNFLSLRRKRIGDDWVNFTISRKVRKVDVKFESEKKINYRFLIVQ